MEITIRVQETERLILRPLTYKQLAKINEVVYVNLFFCEICNHKRCV